MTEQDEVKRISVSGKRQMTIPKQFYDELNITDVVLCSVENGAIVIKPVKKDIDFSREILHDLINEGYEANEELVKEFIYRKSQMKDAIQRMIEEARDYQTYKTVDDLFDSLFEEDDE